MVNSAVSRLQRWFGLVFFIAWAVAACGFSNELSGPNEGNAADSNDEDSNWPSLPLLVELQDEDFPHAETIILVGQGDWTQSRIQVDANTPVRIRVEASSPAAHHLVDEGSNQIRRYAGEEALVPLAPYGAVMMRFASRQVNLGSSQAFVAAETGELEFAANSDDPRFVWKVHVAWGQPWVPFDLGLDRLSLAEETGEVWSKGRTLDSSALWSDIGACTPGARLRVRHRSRPKEHLASRDVKGGQSLYAPFGVRKDVADNRVEFQEFAPDSVLFRVGEGLAQPVFVGEDTYLQCDSGGQVGVRINRRMVETASGPSYWSNLEHEVAVDRFTRLGTMIELLPWRAFERPKSTSIAFRKQKFYKTKVRVRSGDLLRVQVGGSLQSHGIGAEVANIPIGGGVDRVADFGEPGGRAWLVPGGRVLANYLRIGDSLIELDGDDVVYAPTDGTVYVGVNTCQTSTNLRAESPCEVGNRWSGELGQLQGERGFVIAVRRDP